MRGIAIGIQSNPEISSLVVGAVRVVLDVSPHVQCLQRKSKKCSDELEICCVVHSTYGDDHSGGGATGVSTAIWRPISFQSSNLGIDRQSMYFFIDTTQAYL
jgi:hypothetical protein